MSSEVETSGVEGQTQKYQLDPDKPEESICLLAGDENVLFFLNKSKRLFVGNDNFSFTLNKHE